MTPVVFCTANALPMLPPVIWYRIFVAAKR